MGLKDRKHTHRSKRHELSALLKERDSLMNEHSKMKAHLERMTQRLSHRGGTSTPQLPALPPAIQTLPPHSYRPGSPVVQVENIHDACWISATKRAYPAGFPMQAFSTPRKIKQCYGKALAYPYQGAYAGRTLYEPPMPDVITEPTGLSYRYEVD